MRLWRDLHRIFIADPTPPSKDVAGPGQPATATSPQPPQVTRDPIPVDPQNGPDPIKPYAGALIQCGSNAINYTPILDSVPTPRAPNPHPPTHSPAPLPTLPTPLPTGASASPLPADTAQIDHDTARRDHEIARADHADAQRNHLTAQADAALSRKDLRAFEEDVARAQQALDAHRVVEQIQQRMRVRPWHILLGLLAITLTLLLAFLDMRLPATLVALASVPSFLWLHIRWQARRAFRLHYELGASYDRAYADLLVACQRLENAGAEWCVQHATKEPAPSAVMDPQTLLQRASRRFRVSRACPPWIRCNLTPPMIPTQGRRLYLFPDHALLYERGRVRAIVYTDMRFTTLPIEQPPPFGPPRPDTLERGPVLPPLDEPLPPDQRELGGVRSQTIGRDATSQLGNRVRRILDRKWSDPVLHNQDLQSRETTTIESRSLVTLPPQGVNLNALHVSQLNWTGPAGTDMVHLISPRNDALALTNAVTRLGSVYAAGMRR